MQNYVIRQDEAKAARGDASWSCAYFVAVVGSTKKRRETKWFHLRKDAVKYGKELEDECPGIDVPEGLGEAVALLQTCPGLTLLGAVEEAVARHKLGAGGSAFVRAACDDYLAWLKGQHARDGTIETYTKVFNLLCAAFPGARLRDLDKSMLEKFVATPAAAESKDHRNRHIRPLWKRADIAYPLAKWQKPYQPRKAVRYWSLREVYLAFLACPPRARGYLALMVFAGIRPEAAWQFKQWQISFEKRSIFVPESLDKTSTHDYTISDFKGPIFDWLKVYPLNETVDLVAMRKTLKRRGGPAWGHDICRHTAGTMWLAALGMNECRRLLHHADFSLIKKHYAADIDLASATELMSLTPADVYPGGDTSWDMPRVERGSKVPRALAATYLRLKEMAPVMVRPEGMEDEAK